MALWQLSSIGISSEESAAIPELAQVLVMTAANMMQKSAAAISAFDNAYATVATVITSSKAIIEQAQTNAALDKKTKSSLVRLSKIVDGIESLRSRLHDPSASHSNGFFSLGELSAGLGDLLESMLRPQYGRCLRGVVRQGPAPAAVNRNQVVDASTPGIAPPALDKALYTALQQDDKTEAQRLLELGADPSYMLLNCFCFRLRSSVAKANKSEVLQNLLHSFGCDDPDLRKSETVIRRENVGKRLDECLQQISAPSFQATADMPLFPDEMSQATDSGEWIKTLRHVIDIHFSKFKPSTEIFSPDRLYHGKAQVLLVLLDDATCRCPGLCDRFAELDREGCQVIGVPMPGFKIDNYAEWWPASMPAFKYHSLFFDCRWEQPNDACNRWEVKMAKELMPQVHQYLDEWTDGSKKQLGAPSAPGALQERIYVSIQDMRESMLPCPRCLERGEANPGAFNRDECVLHFLAVDDMTNTKGMLYCGTCQNRVMVKEVLRRVIFCSYNWGKDLSTQKLAKSLCHKIFLVTEMPYWLDVEGGMGFGDELVSEMREGVAGCKVVLLMISDAFCNSGNCLFEYINIVENNKYVIPLLVPDHGETRTGPSGWTGQYQGNDWWKHAQDICEPQRPDLLTHPRADLFKKIPWNYLANFQPVDLRGEILKDDGSLQDDSAAEREIIRRVISRFFRRS